MTAQIGRFSRVALIRVFPRSVAPAPSAAVRFPPSPSKPGFGPLTPQSSTVVATTRTGELNVGKEADGG
jgi:hypothetical protein